MIAKAVIDGARAAVENSNGWTAAGIAEGRRQESEARWLRDFRRAAQHYLTTGTRFVPPPTPEERLLTAIFGAKK